MHSHEHYHYTSWKERLLALNQNKDMKDIPEQDREDYFISPNEIALKHPELDSTIRINDDGTIDLFSLPNLGIKIDPTTQSINLYGENINLLAKKINFKTKPDGLVWNGYHFNPQLYYEDDKEKGQMLTGTKQYYHTSHEAKEEDRSVKWHADEWNVRPMIKAETKTKYSESMNNILRELGLSLE